MAERVALLTVAREWGRIGCIGFGGPPTHIALLRRLCVRDRKWISETEFEDGIAATNLLPGPASTQLAIYCAWRLRGLPGAVIGAIGFIVPGLILILILSALFLTGDPPRWIHGMAAGAGSAVAAVAVHAAKDLIPASWRRAATSRPAQARWLVYLLAGATATVVLGPYLVLVLVVCGLLEVGIRARAAIPGRRGALLLAPVGAGRRAALFASAGAAGATGGLGALAWVALKVGALSYGGGFVIIPLMQHDAVQTYHWMTKAEFLNAVALGQITPGPVVQTVAVVGYAAAGVGGGLLAAAVAFTPSFLFICLGASRFDRLRANTAIQAFLTGAGPAAIGAIAGSAILLATALDHLWQFGVLAAAAVWLLLFRQGVVSTLLAAAALGALAALTGLPIAQ